MENNKRMSNSGFVFSLATLACILWGSAFPSLKVSYNALSIDNLFVHKILFAGYRFFFASLLIFIYLIYNGIDLKINKTNIKSLISLGVVQTSLQYLFFYTGLSNTTGIKGSILAATGSFFAVILSHVFFHNDKITWNKMLGLVIGFMGVIIVNLSKGKLDLNISFLGEGFLLMAAFCGAFGSILAKNAFENIHPIKANAYQMLFGSLILLGFSSSQIGLFALSFEPSTYLLLLYLSFLSATAFTLWYQLLKYNQVSKISVYKFQIPVFGTILSALFIKGEFIDFRVIISLLFVSLGIIIINKQKQPLPKEKI